MISATSQAAAPICFVTTHQSVTAPEVDLCARWIDAKDLEARTKAWDFLSAGALYRNASIEPNFLLPALKYLANEAVRVIVVENRKAPAGQELVAIVPVENTRVYRLPFKAAEMWKHDQAFDTTPLLAKYCAGEAWAAAVAFLVSEGYSLLSLDTFSANEATNAVLQVVEQQPGVTRFQRARYQRPSFTPEATNDDYKQKFVSKSLKKNLPRLMRRLEELGEISWELSSDESDFEQLAEDFMRIEATGWKGEEGTALACSEKTQGFYREMVRRTAALGKARFLSLKLDGKPIAMVSDIQLGSSVYCYKTAYDDKYASFSPGFHVELENIKYFHGEGIEFADSCTSPGNSSLMRIWGQKIPFQNVIFSLRPGLPEIAVRALPSARRMVKRLRDMKSGSSTRGKA